MLAPLEKEMEDFKYEKTIEDGDTRFAVWWNGLTAKQQFDAEYPPTADYSDGRDRSFEHKMDSFYKAINEGKA